MHSLFSTKNITKMKTLTEGLGIPLENKYGHPFTGFVGARTLLTCNGLCCPFVEPSSSRSGYDQTQYKDDKEAMEERTVLVRFDTKFDPSLITFDEKEWAQCLLYMGMNFQNLPKPDRAPP